MCLKRRPSCVYQSPIFMMVLASIVTLVFDSFHLFLFTSYVIVTVLSPQNGWTALMWASFNGKADAVRELLSGGAKVDMQDEVRHNTN